MKAFAFLGVILVVASAQATFVEDFANFTNSLLTLQENPSKIDILSIKIDALFDTTQYYGVSRRVYQSIFNTLRNIRYLSYRMKNSDNILQEINNLQDSIDAIFDGLNLQRDVDESELPSKINELIDEFVSKYISSSVELFDNMFTQGKHLEESAEKLADESITLVDSLAENIGKCLIVPKTDFKEVYQCHQNTRGVLPNLSHNSALLSAIVSDLDQLDRLHLDGETSLTQLLSEIGRERYTLLNNIQEVRDQREAEKDKQNSNSSTENVE